MLDMVLDTDTYNEVDDQFALCYSLLSQERLNVMAVYAAPFFNDRSSGPMDGMEKSYDEIVRLLGKMGRSADGFAYKGSGSYLPDEHTPVLSPAAEDLVNKARAQREGLLYVVAIGAITNVASAILMAPDIVERIYVVWLGGQRLSANSAAEFNLSQDVAAARVVYGSGCPMACVPCGGVASHMLATPAELREHIGGKNALCDDLIALFSAYSEDHFGWAKEIWDIAAVAYLVNPAFSRAYLEPSPILSYENKYSRDTSRHPVYVVEWLDRNAIFRDMYTKLAGFTVIS